MTLIVFFPHMIFCQWGQLVHSHLEKLENGCSYTIALAQMMPDTSYNFVPAGDMMTFRDQLIHLSENLVWLSSTYLMENKRVFPYDKASLQKATASEILRIVKESCFIAKEQMMQMDTMTMLKSFTFGKNGQLNKIQFLNLIQDHHTHHRGQMLVYLRLKGIKPPKYVGW